MLGQACVILLAFADNIMIGWYGVDSLAASSFVNNMMNLFILIELGFASGMTPLVGAHFGRGDFDAAGLTLLNSLKLNTIIGLLATAVILGIYPFLDRFGQSTDLLALIRPY